MPSTRCSRASPSAISVNVSGAPSSVIASSSDAVGTPAAVASDSTIVVGPVTVEVNVVVRHDLAERDSRREIQKAFGRYVKGRR